MSIFVLYIWLGAYSIYIMIMLKGLIVCRKFVLLNSYNTGCFAENSNVWDSPHTNQNWEHIEKLVSISDNFIKNTVINISNILIFLFLAQKSKLVW